MFSAWAQPRVTRAIPANVHKSLELYLGSHEVSGIKLGPSIWKACMNYFLGTICMNYMCLFNSRSGKVRALNSKKFKVNSFL